MLARNVINADGPAVIQVYQLGQEGLGGAHTVTVQYQPEQRNIVVNNPTANGGSKTFSIARFQQRTPTSGCSKFVVIPRVPIIAPLK